MKLAAALGRSVSFFVDEPAHDVSVVRREDRAKVYTSKQGGPPQTSRPLRPLSDRRAEATVDRSPQRPTPMNHPARSW